MAEVMIRMLVTGQVPGHNVCTVSMTSGSSEKIIVSEGRGRTALQAEIDGLRMALDALRTPCDVELRTRSRELLRRVSEMDMAPHAVRGVLVRREAANV